MNTELLGDVVAFQDPREAVSIAQVRDALATAGLPHDAAPDLSPRAAFSRACKELKENRQIDKVSLDKDTRDTKFQLTQLDRSNGHIDFRLECFAFLNLDTGIIRCEDSGIETQARELFAAAMQARTATDITRIVQGMFKAKADLFALVPNKGVAYFVPECHRPFTDQIERFYTALGGKLCRFPVPKGTETGNANVRDAVAQGMEAALAELESTAATWDETTRESTMEKFVERWQTAQFKIEAYAEYLGQSQENALARAAQVKQKLSERITAVGELKEKAKAEKDTTESGATAWNGEGEPPAIPSESDILALAERMQPNPE
jgi:hypothetical protein